MLEIRDCCGRLACKGDAFTGLIESVYKKSCTRTKLAIGATIHFEREGIATDVTRVDEQSFQVKSDVIK